MLTGRTEETGQVSLPTHTYQPYIDGRGDDPFATDRISKLKKLVLHEADILLRHADKAREIRILDLGCADGYFLQILRDALNERMPQDSSSFRLYGLDVAIEAVEKCHQRGFRCELCNLNTGISYDDEFFDIVLSSEVIEHVISTDRYMVETRRVMRNDATLILTTPNLAAWFNRVLLLVGFQPIHSEVSPARSDFGKRLLYRIMRRPPSLPMGHLRLFTLRALADCLRYYDFRIQKAEGFSYHPIPLNRMFSRLSPSLADSIIIVAKK